MPTATKKKTTTAKATTKAPAKPAPASKPEPKAATKAVTKAVVKPALAVPAPLSEKQVSANTKIAQAAMAAINKKFGSDSAVQLASNHVISEVREVIPCGEGSLDYYLCGVGGLPVGRTVEVLGAPGSGKTALALTFAAQCQRMGGLVIWAECENTIERKRAEVFGVDPSQMIIIQKDSLDESLHALIIALDMVPEGAGPVLLVIDSLAAPASLKEMDEGLEGKDAFGSRNIVINKAIRQLISRLPKKRAAWLVVNQSRLNLADPFDIHHSAGGMFLKFQSSLRLHTYVSSKIVDKDNNHIGRLISITNAKSKVGMPFRKTQLRLLFKTGWDTEWAVISHVKTLGGVPAGARFDAKTFAAAIEFVTAHGWDAMGVHSDSWEPDPLDAQPPAPALEPLAEEVPVEVVEETALANEPTVEPTE